MSYLQNSQRRYPYSDRQVQNTYVNRSVDRRAHQRYPDEFHKFDKNNDGQVSFGGIHTKHEFPGESQVPDVDFRVQSQVPINVVREQFENGNKQANDNQDVMVVVSLDEMKGYRDMSREESLFRSVDLNDDGYIDFSEYCIAKQNGKLGGRSRGSPFPNLSRREFYLADTKRVGKISYKEFVNARRKGLLGGERVVVDKLGGLVLDNNVLSIIGLFLSSIMFFFVGVELGRDQVNYSLCREYGYLIAASFCLYLIGMLVFSAGADWCATDVYKRGSLYFTKFMVLCGISGLAAVSWGMALGFTMNDGERYLVESCAYVLGICCFVIAVGRIAHPREYICEQIIAWLASFVMFFIGIFFILFGHVYGEGDEDSAIYSICCLFIGGFLLIYVFILITELGVIKGFC